MATPVEAIWQAFTEQSGVKGDRFQTRWFGPQDQPAEIDRLNNLILKGQKRATTKPLAYYSAEQEAIPQAGDYFVLLDGQMKPVAVIKTVVSELIPFLRVSAEHAYNEGEGDCSLEDWRERSLHKFERLMANYDNQFSTDDPVVTELFEVVYRR